MRRTPMLVLGLLGAAGMLALALVLQPGGVDAQNEAKQKSEQKADLAALSKKLDNVLANQQRILTQLDAMMQELGVVKVRCTR